MLWHTGGGEEEPCAALATVPHEHEFTRWNHYGFVREGKDMRIYVNGEQMGFSSGHGPLPADFTRMYVGSSEEHLGVEGWLDDFMIAGEALPAEDMAELARR